MAQIWLETSWRTERQKMKSWVESFMEESSDLLVCAYCHEFKGEAKSCCDKKSWRLFSALAIEEQMDLARSEWDKAFGATK
jgi:hypothetical protein